MVKSQCTNAVKESIQKIGLKHPVVVIKTTKEQWEEERKSYNFVIAAPDVDGTFYQIRFGHNRVAALLELGETSVDCIICDSAAEAAVLGKEQALWQKQNLFKM